MAEKEEPSLKLKTARTIKWNTFDRLGTQVLYAVVGVVLANLLSKEDFGLVGALVVFQAFGNLFVDSGFGSALLQRKDPDERDFSTVFWFNLIVACAIYVILFFCAPLIADIFQGDTRLIPLSRVMFLTFILNSLSMVQVTRLMKRMNVKMVAMANMVALAISGTLGMVLAFNDFGPWALVWQAVTLSAVKSAWLWATGHWHPRCGFHFPVLKKFWKVGTSVFSASALDMLALHAYSFVIGAFYNLASLGVYTQADKWSKMGTASLAQVFTASFVPLLSRVQDDPDNFRRYMARLNRFAAFILFPAMIGLASIGAPLFHAFFGTKWDAAIPLFQILALRGILVVLVSLCYNYLLALGRSRRMIVVEIVKDGLVFVAILCTVWFRSVELLVWGQFAASLVVVAVVMTIMTRATGYSLRQMLRDMFPFLIAGTLCGGAALMTAQLLANPWLQLVAMIPAGMAVYLICMRAINAPELKESAAYIFGRFRKNINNQN